jgi:chorismate mutase
MVSAAMAANKLQPDAIISIIFVATSDLDAAFPARGARSLGLEDVALLDMVSPAVSGSMPRVIRMLLTCESPVARADVRHVYLGEARALRPDLAVNGGEQA